MVMHFIIKIKNIFPSPATTSDQTKQNKKKSGLGLCLVVDNTFELYFTKKNPTKLDSCYQI